MVCYGNFLVLHIGMFAALTNVRAKQHVNFKSWGSEIFSCDRLGMKWYTWLYIVCGHVNTIIDYEKQEFCDMMMTY